MREDSIRQLSNAHDFSGFFIGSAKRGEGVFGVFGNLVRELLKMELPIVRQYNNKASYVDRTVGGTSEIRPSFRLTVP